MDAGNFGSIGHLGFRFPTESREAAPRTHHSPRPCDTPRPATGQDDATTATLRYRRSERTALFIETQEGDIVCLKIKVRDSATATATTDTDTAEPATELSISSRSSLKISFHVEGDLNAAELAAIRSVVEQAGALAAEFFANDLPAAFATAQELDIDGAQLAKVGLRLSVREQLTYSGTAAAWQVPTNPALPAPTPAVEPETHAPTTASDPPAETEPTPTAPATAAAETTAAPTTPAEPPLPPAAAPAVAGQALALIADFLTQLLDTLGTDVEPTDDAGDAPSMSVSLKLRIFQATVINLAVTQLPTSSGDEDTAAGMPLVADTLDALAAAQQPALDIHA